MRNTVAGLHQSIQSATENIHGLEKWWRGLVLTETQSLTRVGRDQTQKHKQRDAQPPEMWDKLKLSIKSIIGLSKQEKREQGGRNIWKK